MGTVISLRDLKKEYVNEGLVTHVLHGVTFDIQEGEFVSLMGPSGSGKSTLMHILGFLDHLTSGTYIFKNKDASAYSEDELAFMRRKEVSFVFQSFNLLSNSTVLENVMLPMIYSKIFKNKRIETAKKALDNVGLSHRLGHKANQLSGGERQRVAIARAVVNEPSVIFADEPTGNLDTKSGEMILHLLQGFHKEGHTIVMVTHEYEAAEHAQRIIQLRDGVIVSDKKDYIQRVGEFHK